MKSQHFQHPEKGSSSFPLTVELSKGGSTNNPVLEKKSDYDLICFCHLRWDFVYQRPQHLISRFAKVYPRVFFVEEPMHDSVKAYLEVSPREGNLSVVIPHMEQGLSEEASRETQKRLLDEFFVEYRIEKYKFWYYTPMALTFSDHYEPDMVIYDCMDELCSFKFAPQTLKNMEAKLLQRSDIVFTGGHTLYQAKKDKHENIHPFPSSIDRAHFALARQQQPEPKDQKNIPHPRLGFYGVIDERFDIDLIAGMAKERPDWHFVMLGPIVKIDPASLPKMNNVHFLGSKGYNELPTYVSGWDIALIPFLINDSTKYISPTKTPEYLAAGKPVISTPITDVVDPYGKNNLVSIASTVDEFVKAADYELKNGTKDIWLSQVDEFLLDNSWDQTWSRMSDLINKTLENKI